MSSWSAQNLSQALVPAGVTVKKGEDLVNIYCPIVISSAGLFNTYEHLLPEQARCLPGKQMSCVALLQVPWTCPLLPADSAWLMLPPASGLPFDPP